MNKTVLALAAGSIFTGIWATRSGKFLGLPKIDKKKGLVASAILGGLAIFDLMRDRKRISQISGISHNPPLIKNPQAMAGYDKTNASVGRHPLGHLTGFGRDERRLEIPASATSMFPYTSGKLDHGDLV